MRTIATILPILVGALAAGCGPENSIFSLSNKDDKVIEDRIVGEWVMHGGTSEIKPDEESGVAIFKKGEGEGEDSYEVTIPDVDANGTGIVSSVRFVRLGRFLFVDFAPGHLEKGKNAVVTYQTIDCHVFGRVRLDGRKMRIDLLGDGWISEQVKVGKLPLPLVRTGSGILGEGTFLTATTEQLRSFALEHAEDEKIFSETVAFERKK
jgi:hypothetical protein